MVPKLIGLLCLLLTQQSNGLSLINDDVSLVLDLTDDGIAVNLTLDGVEKLSGKIGEGKQLADEDCDGASSCTFQGDNYTLTIGSIKNGFNISWLSRDTNTQFQDCFDLQADQVSWYGGQEQYTAKWPIENMKISDEAYRSSRLQNGAVAERYWLNSKGGYVFVGDKVPLFLDQNSAKDGSICFAAKIEKPFLHRDTVLLEYSLVAKSDPKEAQLHAVQNYLRKPSGHPNKWIVQKPIWTTWAKYKADIDDETVLAFARDIAEHGFTGQLEIDDLWETCYGDITFNDNFANINATVKTLKEVGFTVTLWTHPFVNDDCEETTRIGRENGYFVKSANGSDFTSWWDGSQAHHIDFTNEDARNWYVNRLKLIQEKHGIDSFKFDAGENDWAPEDADLTGDVDEAPNSLTEAYLRTCATFGDLIEVRSAWRTQDLPIFVRMQDKDSRWGLDNGLHNLITTLLQMNLNGYPLVLPDMVGGNGYGSDLPTAEILARWTQANVFMPAMQFSYLPWEITSDDFDGLSIIKKFVALHEKYSDEILAAMNNSISSGVPVNPPIWWVDPTNPDALKNNDEYLLGETILVAPVIKEGAVTRDVVIPSGSWMDGNTRKVYEGPQVIKDYPAPIDVLPYFIRQ